MEALQMVKFTLKKDHLNFMLAWMTKKKDLTTDNPDSDLLSWLKSEGDPDSLNNIQDKIMLYMDQYEE
jgi:hypothetical protein